MKFLLALGRKEAIDRRLVKLPCFCGKNLPRTNANAVKTECGMAHGGCHLPDLPVSAFFQFQFNPASGNVSSISDIWNSRA